MSSTIADRSPVSLRGFGVALACALCLQLSARSDSGLSEDTDNDASPVSGAPVVADNKSSSVEWLTNTKSGLKQARERRKLMLVEVGAEWCPDCRRLESKIIPDATVQQFLQENYVCVKLDADGWAGTRMQKQHGNHVIPTLYVFSRAGKFVGSKPAEHVNPASFIRLLSELNG